MSLLSSYILNVLLDRILIFEGKDYILLWSMGWVLMFFFLTEALNPWVTEHILVDFDYWDKVPLS